METGLTGALSPASVATFGKLNVSIFVLSSFGRNSFLDGAASEDESSGPTSHGYLPPYGDPGMELIEALCPNPLGRLISSSSDSFAYHRLRGVRGV